jgi:hypothetical protein
MKILNYSKLLNEYDRALVEQLRGLELEQEFLASWVPDSNSFRSIINLVDVVYSAGITSIVIEFDRDYLTRDDEKRLLQALVECDAASFETVAGGVNLQISGISELRWNFSDQVSDRNNQESRSDLKRFTAPNMKKTDQSLSLSGRITLNRKCRFEGEFSADSKSIFTVTSASAKLSLQIAEETHVISKALHAGVENGEEKVLWDVLCETFEGAPLLEGVEHGVLKVVHKLAELNIIGRGPGILLPSNAGEPFLSMQNTILSLYSNYRKETGFKPALNEFDLLPGRAWSALTDEARSERVSQSIAAFLALKTRRGKNLAFERIEPDLDGYPVRVFVDFSDIESKDRPDFARKLEVYLKNNLEYKLQVYAIEIKDRNRIRRLG